MWTWHAGLTAFLAGYAAQLAAVFFMEHRRPAQMTAWLLLSFVFPFIGFAAYLLLGKKYLRSRKLDRYKQETSRFACEMSKPAASAADVGNKELEQQDKLFKMLTRMTPFPITSRNKTKVLTDGRDTFESILEELEAAQRHIHLDYYTIRDDGIGTRFLEVLVRKAKLGVEVRVLYDGIGSLHLGEPYLRRLKEAGASYSCFLPPRVALCDRKLNYRNHRKIVVVDGIVGFVGGINIGDEYLGKEPKLGFWRDTHLRLEGDSVYFLQELFLKDWAFAAGEKLDEHAYMPVNDCGGEERVQMVPSKPGHNDQKIKEVMFAAITAAKYRIYMTTPYFIPDPGLLMALRTAALGGVDIKLIIPGIADSRLVLLASLSYIHDLLDAGVQVYRYEKGFIHAKVMIVDRMLATVGTANVDMRSLNSNFEINAVLFDEGTIGRLERDFMNDLENSAALDPERFIRRPWKQKAAESILNMLSPLL